eukprot:TRINITY_DN44974_c0_g1_i1.p1 TRINITY_DN44974_c0_g1~~TRINITY_DN44974_c0_g1_i1.p1  ORF type:complete len:573 (-),score=92.00 TRINITY_DN44974_c0_g1_i1:191-1909(-)
MRRSGRGSPASKSRGRSRTKAQPGCFKVSSIFACRSKHSSSSRVRRSRPVSQDSFTEIASLVPAESQRVAETQRPVSFGVRIEQEASRPSQVARAPSRAERAVFRLVALGGWALPNGRAARRVGVAMERAALCWRRGRSPERQPSRSLEEDDASLPDMQNVLQELERCRMRLEDNDACTQKKTADACVYADTPSTRASLGLSAEQSSPQSSAHATSSYSDASPITAGGRGLRRRCVSADCQQVRLHQAQELFSEMLAPSRQTSQKQEVQLPEPARQKDSISPTRRRWNRPRSALSSRENAAQQPAFPALEPLNGSMPRFPGLRIAEPSFFPDSKEAGLPAGSMSPVPMGAAKNEDSPTAAVNVEFCELLTAALAERPSQEDVLSATTKQIAQEPAFGASSPLKNLPRAPIPQKQFFPKQIDSVEPALPQEDSPQRQYIPPERRPSPPRSESPLSLPQPKSLCNCKPPMRLATLPRSCVVEVEGTNSSAMEREVSPHPFAPPAAQLASDEEDLKEEHLQRSGSQDTLSASPTTSPSKASNFSKRQQHRSFAEIMAARRRQTECSLSVVCTATE